MAQANPLWGAPRIHGELLKLGLTISQRSVARIMPRRRGPPSQAWKTFLSPAPLISPGPLLERQESSPSALPRTPLAGPQ